MILKLYILGVCLCTVWFALMAMLIFERWSYDKQSEEDRDSIDSIMNVLIETNPDNPQRAYLIISLIITIFWPIMIPYMMVKSRMK